MIRRVLCLSIACAAVSGCAHNGLMPNNSQRTSAPEAFEYGLLAYNSYDRDAWINLPNDTSLIVQCDNDEIGLAFSVFKKERSGRPEYVFAFRGTEPGEEGKKDWKYGNLSYHQQERSEGIVARFLAGHADGDITFAGHSLGGALALHNGARVLGARVYVFNTSPRFYPPNIPPSGTVEPVSIVEPGEVLGIVRIFHKTLSPVRFDCLRKGGPIFEHSMLHLGVCLTRIAASESARKTAIAERARAYLDLNSWAVDAAEHPLVSTKPEAPCIR